MSKSGTIIIVDDNKGVLTAVEILLKSYFSKVVTLSSPVTLITVMQEEMPEVILLDMNFTSGINTGNEGLFWLHEIKKVRPELPIVLFTAYADIELAIRGIKEGATDFIVKPWNNQKLVETLQTAAQSVRNEKKGGARKESAGVQPIYWGESKAMQQLRMLIEKVAVTDANILITGENGTGKEILAREIHALSNRRQKEMIAVDMGAITESLFESELFGHVKGSFTGAIDNKTGAFVAAHGGTIFLDEIGDLPLHMQVKLLRVLQQRKVTRVGGTEPIDINVRVIAATNKNLEQMVREGQFREDLYYRLNVVSVQIPPLRERKEDIVPLLNHFLTVVNQKYHTQKTIFSDTIDAFENYPWPGNVRELENVLENLVITTPGDEIRRENLPKKFWSENGEPAAVGMREILPLKVTVERVELAAIQHAIDQCGSVRKAAAALGVDPSTIVRKMQGHKEK